MTQLGLSILGTRGARARVFGRLEGGGADKSIRSGVRGADVDHSKCRRVYDSSWRNFPINCGKVWATWDSH